MVYTRSMRVNPKRVEMVLFLAWNDINHTFLWIMQILVNWTKIKYKIAHSNSYNIISDAIKFWYVIMYTRYNSIR